jgi:serine/threonine protein kinase
MLQRLEQLDHEHIVHLWGHVENADSIFIVMELCEGGELMEQLEHMGNYTENDAADLIESMADVLMYLHDHGIVHRCETARSARCTNKAQTEFVGCRDIKPENLLLVDKNDCTTVKMSDFGLANMMENTWDTADGQHRTVCGTPAFMAPEVYVDGVAALHPKTDMWSLGVVLYMLLSGQLPFTGTIVEIRRQAASQDIQFREPIWRVVSDAAKDLILHLLVVDPSTRLDAQQVLEHPWITGEGRNDVVLSETVRKLALFNAKKKFKGLAHAMVATNRMKSLFGTKARQVGSGVAAVGRGLNDKREQAAPWSNSLFKGAEKFAGRLGAVTSGFVDNALDLAGGVGHAALRTAADTGAALPADAPEETPAERKERNAYHLRAIIVTIGLWID